MPKGKPSSGSADKNKDVRVREEETFLNYHCNLCPEKFEDLEEYRAHRETDLHMFLYNRKVKQIIPGLAFCMACDMHILTAEDWKKHIAAPRHQKCKESLQAIGEPGEFDVPLGCSEAGVLGDPIEDLEKGIDKQKAISNGYRYVNAIPKGTPLIGLKFIKQKGVNENELTEYKCSFCDETFRYKTRVQHMNSKKHRLGYMEKHYPEYHAEVVAIPERERLKRNNKSVYYASKVEAVEEEDEDTKKLREKFLENPKTTIRSKKEWERATKMQRMKHGSQTAARGGKGPMRGGKGPARGSYGPMGQGRNVHSRLGPGPMRGGPGPMRDVHLRHGQEPMRSGPAQMRDGYQGQGGYQGYQGPMRGGPSPMMDYQGGMRGGPGPMRGDPGPARYGSGSMRDGPGYQAPMRGGPEPRRHDNNYSNMRIEVPLHDAHASRGYNANGSSQGYNKRPMGRDYEHERQNKRPANEDRGSRQAMEAISVLEKYAIQKAEEQVKRRVHDMKRAITAEMAQGHVPDFAGLASQLVPRDDGAYNRGTSGFRRY